MSDEAFFDGTHEDLAHPKAVKSLKEWLVACHNAMSQASSICLNSFEDLEPDFVKNLKTVAPNVANTPTYFLGIGNFLSHGESRWTWTNEFSQIAFSSGAAFQPIAMHRCAA